MQAFCWVFRSITVTPRNDTLTIATLKYQLFAKYNAISLYPSGGVFTCRNDTLKNTMALLFECFYFLNKVGQNFVYVTDDAQVRYVEYR